MALTFIRTLIIFIVLVIVVRLMGKRQIGEMQPFEFIVTLIIADLACLPMADISTPLIYGVVAVVTLFLLHQIMTIIEQKGGLAKRIISGKPSVVIDKNGVNLKELKRNNLGVDDLIESMRSAGYFCLEQIDYAIFESNGKLSVLENQQMTKTTKSVPILIVNDGKISNNNCKLIKTDKEQVVSFIKKQGQKLKNVEILTVDGLENAYLKTKNTKFQMLKFNLPTGVKW